MAYYSLHAYDADVWIPSFVGLNEYGAGDNVDVRYAVEAENVETPGGVLQPACNPAHYDGHTTGDVGTLMKFFRRWSQSERDREVMVYSMDGKIYYTTDKVEDSVQIDFPTGVLGFTGDTWSYVTYEVPAQNGAGKVDVLLISNAEDGVYMIVPPDAPYSWDDADEHDWEYHKGTEAPYKNWGDLKEAKWSMRSVDTRAKPDDDNDDEEEEEPYKKFAFIERYAERIWGGGWADHPDTLYYSRAYDPTNWTAYDPDEDDDPADAAGEIQQPSWDGDSFTTLRRFGDGLIAFKEHHIWRVTGTDPSNYTFYEQYGTGCPYPRTIVVDGERILFANDDGLCVYDGSTVQPFMRQLIEKTWDQFRKRNLLKNAHAVLFEDRYYLSVVSAMIIYAKAEGSFLYGTYNVANMIEYKNKLFTLGSTRNFGYLNYDSWKNGIVFAKLSKWVSPWMDFNYKRITKGGFDLYFTPEVRDRPVTFTFRVRTEKKVKEKTYTVNPMTEIERENGKLLKPKRLHFSGTGRRFRVEIEVVNETTRSMWRLLGGLHLVVETDSD